MQEYTSSILYHIPYILIKRIYYKLFKTNLLTKDQMMD